MQSPAGIMAVRVGACAGVLIGALVLVRCDTVDAPRRPLPVNPAPIASLTSPDEHDVNDADPRSIEADESGETPPNEILLTALGRIQIPAAETLAFDAGSGDLFVSSEDGVRQIALGGVVNMKLKRTLDLAKLAGHPKGNVSQVAVDGTHGIGAACVIPELRAAEIGRVALFRTSTGALLTTLPVGYCPDSLAFTPDGEALVIVNEGEPGIGRSGGLMDPPGSISVIDLSNVRATADAAKLSAEDVETYQFGGEALARALEATKHDHALRIHPANRMTPSLDLEPDYVVIEGDHAYISLQENNAIAAFDLSARKFIRISGLGVFERRLDGSRTDGGAHIDTVLPAAPMPDQIALVRIGGETFIASANEGDTRSEAFDDANPLGDETTIGALRGRGAIETSNTPAGADDLQISSFDWTTSDGEAMRHIVMGARSVSLWRTDDLSLVGDTGSTFEEHMAERAPDRFNTTNKPGAKADARSVARGPEPEGVIAGAFFDLPLVFAGLERPGAIVAIDVSTPSSPTVIGFHDCAGEGDLGPEGLYFIPAEQSPIGAPLLVAAFEESGTIVCYLVGGATP